MSAELTLRIGGNNLSDRQTMLVSQIIESADRATEIVEHLLDLTRARLGSGLPVIKEYMDMEFVSKQIVDETRAMHPNRKITLETSGDLKGNWDKPRIGQVFSNLLGNAVQYGFTDSSISVKVEGKTEEVILSVHNEGVPIHPDKIGRIFDSLTRGEDNGDDEDKPWSMNLGLGLYITKEIVTAHGGTVRVTSTEKEGTIFTARFPR